MVRVNDIRQEFIRKHKRGDVNADGLLEIIGASFIADEQAIFGTVNTEYVAKEIEWYESQSLSVLDIVDTPKIWLDISDTRGNINSNYGWCIFSEANGSQYANVVRKLQNSKSTRQATMIYNRPTMHVDAIANGMSDFICTNAVTYRCVKGVLHAVVQMRSNDVVYGYKNDFAWQKHVLMLLCEELSLRPGYITWQAASLHIYPRHFHLLDK